MIEVDADRMDVFADEGKAVFQGSVNATKGGMLLLSDRLTLMFDKTTKKVRRMLAEGEVRITWEDKKASCDQAEYMLESERIVFTGDVVITRGEELLRGQKVTVDTAENRQVVEGEGSRVKIRVLTGEETGILQWEK